MRGGAFRKCRFCSSRDPFRAPSTADEVPGAEHTGCGKTISSKGDFYPSGFYLGLCRRVTLLLPPNFSFGAGTNQIIPPGPGPRISYPRAALCREMHAGGRDYGGQAGSLGQVGDICKRRRRGACSPRLCAPLGLPAGGQPSELLQRDGTGRRDGRGGRGGSFQQPHRQFVFASSWEPTFLLAQEVVKEGNLFCLGGNSQDDRSVSLKGPNAATCCFLLIPSLAPKC